MQDTLRKILQSSLMACKTLGRDEAGKALVLARATLLEINFLVQKKAPLSSVEQQTIRASIIVKKVDGNLSSQLYINAIKSVRERTSVDLKQAKNMCDTFRSGHIVST